MTLHPDRPVMGAPMPEPDMPADRPENPAQLRQTLVEALMKAKHDRFCPCSLGPDHLDRKFAKADIEAIWPLIAAALDQGAFVSGAAQPLSRVREAIERLRAQPVPQGITTITDARFWILGEIESALRGDGRHEPIGMPPTPIQTRQQR